MMVAMSKKILYTIGHSTRTFEEFLACLNSQKITHLVDIRTIPKSRRVPWFNKETLSKTLKKHHIAYTHLKELGGLRKPEKNSINSGWHNEGFRGFADYMQTEEFLEGLTRLNDLVKTEKVAIMCAEALPWQCHRSLVSDAEIARKIDVFHIMNDHTVKEHELTSFAVIDKKQQPVKIYYPDPEKSANQLNLF